MWGSGTFSLFPLLLLLLVRMSCSTRCYTDIAASKANSTECGHGTGCIKVYIDSEEYLMRMHHQTRDYYPGIGGGGGPSSRRGGGGVGGGGGEIGRLPQLPPRLRNNPVVLRGCFALQVAADRCYLARDGYSYCWCDKDLCNGGGRTASENGGLLLSMAVLIATGVRTAVLLSGGGVSRTKS